MFTLYYAQLFTGSTKMFNSSNLLNCVLFPIVKPNYSKLNRQLENKVIVITGASYGIGESLVNLLANFKLKSFCAMKIVSLKPTSLDVPTITFFIIFFNSPIPIPNLINISIAFLDIKRPSPKGFTRVL